MATNGHATSNVFKRWYNVIDGIFTPLIIAMPNTLHMVYEFVYELTFIPSSCLGFGFAHTSNGKTYTR